MGGSRQNRPVMEAVGMSEKLLLTSREACKLLGISSRTLWAWKKEGRIPFIQIGRVVRFSRAALEAWVAEQLGRQSAPRDGEREAADA